MNFDSNGNERLLHSAGLLVDSPKIGRRDTYVADRTA